MTTYTLNDGATVTTTQIQSALEAGQAVLVHWHGNGQTNTGLMLDGQHHDTRGACESVWDESWTTKPETLAQCLSAAR